VETGRYEPSLALAFASGALFAMPIETIFHGHRQPHRFTASGSDIAAS
jgi:DNA-binding XRE family transcriptional regulator